jgi:hypothetical protein
MTELVFIVSRSEPKQYLYLKHFYADDHREVILDRRAGGATPEPEATAAGRASHLAGP